VPARCRRGADAVLAEFSRGFRGIQRVPRGYGGTEGVLGPRRVSGARAFARVLICVFVFIRVRACLCERMCVFVRFHRIAPSRACLYRVCVCL
jgi:hypothetical protein